MRKWIVMALFNWLRKPANRQKAKAAMLHDTPILPATTAGN